VLLALAVLVVLGLIALVLRRTMRDRM
jgi:hypothetical protein